MVENGRRIIVFSQFVEMLDLIDEALTAEGLGFVKLTGQTKDRETPVARFQAGEVPIFLISLKAGGTGLTLTAADTVIHYDPWWNPAVEAQATDRAHRIGQDKTVFVYKLIVGRHGRGEDGRAPGQQAGAGRRRPLRHRARASPSPRTTSRPCSRRCRSRRGRGDRAGRISARTRRYGLFEIGDGDVPRPAASVC